MKHKAVEHEAESRLSKEHDAEHSVNTRHISYIYTPAAHANKIDLFKFGMALIYTRNFTSSSLPKSKL